jgi:hypothetical protein
MKDFQFTLTVAAVSMVAILSACGSSGSSGGGSGSGSGSSGGGSGSGSTASFYDKLADGDRLARRLDQLDLTPSANMPASGTATYVGLIGVEYDPGPGFANYDEAVGDLRLSADFSNSTITGSMANWVGRDAGRFSGQLDVTNGSITGNELGAVARGTLSANGQRGDVRLEMDGGFLGNSGQGVAGMVDGSVTYRDGYRGAVEGIFGAERR